MTQVFLSHAGPDADAARAVKALLSRHAAARDHPLDVWLDLDELTPGAPWKPQIETAIDDARAFVVLVGAHGIANWVQAEVDVALSRAVKDPGFRLIPVLFDNARSVDLTPFVRRFHAVRDPANHPAQAKALMDAILGGQGDIGARATVGEPFPGLRAMDETWSDRFFGRKTETEALISRLRHTPMVSIVAASGSGKSSLAMAGVGAHWRGGALSEDRPSADDPTYWNVVRMRPGRNPLEELRTAVRRNAEQLGLTLADQFATVAEVQLQDASRLLNGLECGLPAGQVRTLLILDQAEELLTLSTNAKDRDAFTRMIGDVSALARDQDRLRVLITVRDDYANRLHELPGLDQHTLSPAGAYRLQTPGQSDIRELITQPLAMAGYDFAEDAADLQNIVLEDRPERPGDLAQVQIALNLAWRERNRHGGIAKAYVQIGRTFGALGNEAKRISRDVLTQAERVRLMPLFVRLVSLGPSQGATRRVAPLAEFTVEQRALVDKLAGEDCARLLQVSNDTVEIAHESLMSQWGELGNYIDEHGTELRTLHALTREADDWRANGKPRGRLASRAKITDFVPVVRDKPDWPTEEEKSFLEKSRNARWMERVLTIGAAMLILGLFATSGLFYALSTAAQADAEDKERKALALLAGTKLPEHPDAAIKLLLAAWPQLNPPSTELAVLVRDRLAQAMDVTASSTLIRTQASVSSVVFSPDGNRVLSGSRDNSVRLWDARTGRVLRAFKGHEGWVNSVAFSPDGSLIISGSDDSTLRLWNAKTGQSLRTFEGHKDRVRSVAFGPDGSSIISGSNDRTLRLWDAQTGRSLRTFSGHEGLVTSVAFSPDGSRIISGSSDGSLRLWDAQAAKNLRTFQGHESVVTSVSFNHDGSHILSGSWDKTLRLWDAQTGQSLRTFQGHESHVSSIAFSPDGTRILSGGDDNTLRLWNAQTGQRLRTYTGHEAELNSVAFSPDGSRILSSSGDKTLRLWDAQTGQSMRTFRGHFGWVRSVVFSPDGGRILSGGDDNRLRLWDTQTGQNIRSFEGHTDRVTSVAFSSDGGRILSGSLDGTLRLWNARTGQSLGLAHAGNVTSVAFSPDNNRILAGSSDDALVLWDVQSMHRLGQFNWYKESVTSVAFSPDGSHFLSGSEDTLRLWDAQTGQNLRILVGHKGWVRSVAFSPDGSRILSGSNDGTLRLWDTQTGQKLRTLSGHGGWVSSVAFSPDGSRILSGGNDGTLRLWDAQNGQSLRTFKGHSGPVESVAFSLDGRRIISASRDGTLRLWDIANIQGNGMQEACQMLPVTSGRHDRDLSGLSVELGILSLSEIPPCEDYDPPMPLSWMPDD